MTLEEARSYLLEMCTTQSNCAEYRAIHLAVDALEKQIPKKPIPITRNEHSVKIIGYGCPACHKDVMGSGFYCWCCGQHLDWSDEK